MFKIALEKRYNLCTLLELKLLDLDVSDGKLEQNEFLKKDVYSFKNMKFCVPRESMHEVLVKEIHKSGYRRLCLLFVLELLII